MRHASLRDLHWRGWRELVWDNQRVDDDGRGLMLFNTILQM